MNKLDVQKRVLKNGAPLDLDKFEWDEKTFVFSSRENNLVFDFYGIQNCTFMTGEECIFTTGSSCTFNTGSKCTFNTGSSCTFSTGWSCTFSTDWSCTFTTGSSCTFNTGSRCTFSTGWSCTFSTDWSCTFTTGSSCTFNTGSKCTFNTGSSCTFSTGWSCTFSTDWSCTFMTGEECIFTTGSSCTFNTGSRCTFNTGEDCTFITNWNCTFKTGVKCVIMRRDDFETINPEVEQVIQSCPEGISGFLVDGMLNGVPHIIADGILSKIVKKKWNVYVVINHGETEKSYLIEKEGKYSHGKTLKEAKESLVYKLSDRDTSTYENYTLATVVKKDDAIKMYMDITGACSSGTKYFVDRLETQKSKYSVSELIQLTKNQYGNNKFKQFFERNNYE